MLKRIEINFISILFLLFVFLSLSLPFSPCCKFGCSLAISMGGGEGEKCVRGEGSEPFFLPLVSSFLFSPSPLVPAINLGGPSPLVWVAGTRRGGGKKGERFERGREPFLPSLSLPFRLLPHKLHSANIDSHTTPTNIMKCLTETNSCKTLTQRPRTSTIMLVDCDDTCI